MAEQKRVWVVTKGEYGWNTTVIGVYSSKARAKTAAKNANERIGGDDDAVIAAWVIDG